MGITPDITIHTKKATLKSTAIAVIAMIRMKKLSENWATSKKLHAQLLQKLEGMRRGSGKGLPNGNIGSRLKITRN